MEAWNKNIIWHKMYEKYILECFNIYFNKTSLQYNEHKNRPNPNIRKQTHVYAKYFYSFPIVSMIDLPRRVWGGGCRGAEITFFSNISETIIGGFTFAKEGHIQKYSTYNKKKVYLV